MLGVGHVPLAIPGAEDHDQARGLGGVDGALGPRIGDEPVGCAVEEQRRCVAGVDRAAGQRRAGDRLRGPHGRREALVIARAGVLRAVRDVQRGDRAGRGAADPDARRVDPVLGRLLAQEPHGGLRVLPRLADGGDAGTEVGFRRASARYQPVIDRHAHETLAGEGVGLVDELTRRLVTATEAAAVHPHDRRPARDAVALGLVQVELERDVLAQLVDCLAVRDVGRLADGREYVVAVAQRRRPLGCRQGIARGDRHHHDRQHRGDEQTTHLDPRSAALPATDSALSLDRSGTPSSPVHGDSTSPIVSHGRGGRRVEGVSVEGTMAMDSDRKPILLTVDDDPGVSRAVARDPRRPYGETYRVMRTESGPQALEALRELKLRGDLVAVLLADHRMPDMSGLEFLEEAMDLFPHARRALLTAYADTEAAIDAINVVDLDHYLLKPWDPPEEKLYPIIDSLIEMWLDTDEQAVSRTQVVGHRWSSRSFEVRDFLARNSVPYRWLSSEEPEGQRLLAAAGVEVTKIPLVVTPEGDHLVEPSMGELAAKVGLSTTPATDFYDVVIVGGGPAGPR